MANDVITPPNYIKVNSALSQSANLLTLLRSANVPESVFPDIDSWSTAPEDKVIDGVSYNTRLDLYIRPSSPTHLKEKSVIATSYYNRVPVGFDGHEEHVLFLNENQLGIVDSLENLIKYTINHYPRFSQDPKYPFTHLLKNNNSTIEIIPHRASTCYNQSADYAFKYIKSIPLSFHGDITFVHRDYIEGPDRQSIHQLIRIKGEEKQLTIKPFNDTEHGNEEAEGNKLFKEAMPLHCNRLSGRRFLDFSREDTTKHYTVSEHYGYDSNIALIGNNGTEIYDLPRIVISSTSESWDGTLEARVLKRPLGWLFKHFLKEKYPENYIIVPEVPDLSPLSDGQAKTNYIIDFDFSPNKNNSNWVWNITLRNGPKDVTHSVYRDLVYNSSAKVMRIAIDSLHKEFMAYLFKSRKDTSILTDMIKRHPLFLTDITDREIKENNHSKINENLFVFGISNLNSHYVGGAFYINASFKEEDNTKRINVDGFTPYVIKV